MAPRVFPSLLDEIGSWDHFGEARSGKHRDHIQEKEFVAGLEGAAVVGGVSAVGAGLVSIGIPKDSVLKYDVALKTDKFLLVVHGTARDVNKAKDGMSAVASPLIQA